jgi:hypothetical protein
MLNKQCIMACGALSSFVDYLQQEQNALLDEIAAQARGTFPNASVEKRDQLFVLVEFEISLPCHQQVRSAWGEPVAIAVPPSPPALGPSQRVISHSSSEDDPFHWAVETYLVYGRSIHVGTDRTRIKYLRIDPPGLA